MTDDPGADVRALPRDPVFVARAGGLMTGTRDPQMAPAGVSPVPLAATHDADR